MAAISTATSPLYTAQHPGWNYEPISYAMDELPPPLPARTDRLPWERKELAEQEKQNRQITETQRAYDAAARQKARGGFLNNLSASMKPRFAKWRNTPMPVREAIPSKRDERKFNNKFHFPSYERLLYASELCKTISGTQQILGKVFVSENFFCFRESRLQPKGGRRQRLNLVIPLDDILSISQAEISSHPDPKYAPDFRVLDQWHAKADGIFLYARDFKVHRFFGFWTQQTYHDTFNVLDRQWRSRPYTSTTPLRAGETGLNRSMVPPVRSAAPSVAVLEPAQFQPYSSAMLGSSGFAPSRMSTSQYTQEAPMTSSWRGMQQDQWRSTTEGFSGKQAQSFPSRTERRTLPRGLSDDIRSASISRLRHVATPVPKYGHVISDMNNRIELVPLESFGSGIGQQRDFGLASQGRQFRTSQYAPKRWNQELPMQRSIAPQQRRWSTQEERLHIPTALSNEIRHWDKHNLHHINAPQYQPAGIPLGHVIERRPASFATREQEAPLRRSSWDRGMQQRQTGFVPRERLGFQTVQQQLHTQQRGRSLNPQLRDEIHFFNLRSLRHVRPTVRQWMPQASDIKMRPGGPSQSAQRSWEQGREQRQIEKHGERKRHHHHKHHKASQQSGEPVQLFQYEEFDLTSPSSYERVQVTKLQEQLSRKKFEEQQQQQRGMQQRLAAGSYEAGTA